MTNYIQLAVKYLQQNKHRSLITILGAAVTVTILYALLNTGWGYLLQSRREMRESQDYEMILFTETEEQIQSIINDPLVKSAYIGQYYSYIAGEGRMYENALYVNTVNPYRIDSTFDSLKGRYNVDGRIHDELAWTYLQGSEGSGIVVMIYFSVMIAFIFAIIGVGMIRNSIQLCMFENIRDYGNLRCIGSSKAELKMIIFMQGMVLELIGIAAGTILGTAVTSGLSVYLKRFNWFHIEGGFHILPLLLILATFLIDLYFAMGENAKLVTRMTPVSAIRGEYMIRREKIRRHEKNMIRKLAVKLFGMDGDYAYKSLRRSPGRFFRLIGTMVFGIAAGIMVMILIHSLYAMLPEFGYYQMYIMNTLDPTEPMEAVQGSFPSQQTLQELSDIPEFTEVKSVYSAIGFCASLDDLTEHYTDKYVKNLDYDFEAEKKAVAEWASDEVSLEELVEGINDPNGSAYFPYGYQEVIGFHCIGYDKEDLAREKPNLVDGTLDVSDHGVVLINQIEVDTFEASADNANVFISTGKEIVDQTTYQVGDTIDIVDIGEYHRRIDGKMMELNEEYTAKYHAVLEIDPEDENHRVLSIVRDYNYAKLKLVLETWEELTREGCYKTYTIEGILSEDLNVEDPVFFEGGKVPKLLMAKETYYDLTGTSADEPTGFLYHMDRLPRRNMSAYTDETTGQLLDAGYWNGLMTSYCDVSDYLESIQAAQYLRRVLIGIILIVVFILMVAVINMINATSSNLYLRRREFAQLRVIGVSKPHLTRMVMLEGVIATVVASVIGILLGAAFSFMIYVVLRGIMVDSGNPFYYYFPVGTAILAIVVSVLVVCGAIYVPIRRLGNDLSEDLKTGGD